MANVLNKLIKGENEGKPQTGSNLDRRAYNNMMLYLKEMKLHNVKNLDLAEQIYQLSESSVEKLGEMHDILTEKIVKAPDQADTEELLQSTEHLQEQIGNLTQMLKEMCDKQENFKSGSSVPTAVSPESVDVTELTEAWKQFENQLNQRFENHSAQVTGAVGNAGLDIADCTQEIKAAVEAVQDNMSRAQEYMTQMQLSAQEDRKMACSTQADVEEVKGLAQDTQAAVKEVRTGVENVSLVTDDMRVAVADVRHVLDDIRRALDEAGQEKAEPVEEQEPTEKEPVITREELEELIGTAVRDCIEERLANQNTVVASVIQNETKRTLDEGTAAQRATIEAVIQNEMNRMVTEGNESQRQVISEAVHQEMQAMAAEGVFDQRESIGTVIQNEMSGFRAGLTEAVGDEIAEYNRNVKNMTEHSNEVFEESLENHERIIKKEISLVQEMLENAMEDQLESTIQQLESTKKVIKGYARAAMWASCLALIILFIDILIL